MQSPQRIARELALLSISQLPASPNKLATQQLSQMVTAAIRTLATEIQDTLETASSELKKGNDRLLNSEVRAVDVNSARIMVEDAIKMTQIAINRLGVAVELPEFIQLTNQPEVRSYTMQLISTVQQNRQPIDELLTEVLLNWQLSRITRIDRDILRMAVAEMQYMGQSSAVAINEAVELAKRYSDDEGKRFINGVLRRVSDRLKSDQDIPETLASS
ncbi:transcription antitermination factor NusB [Merismopedia glauca]|uniref:Transcription antitermination protein NusB n=1 Tax=Merismopedia glauca CCAP 1448/3 TaxID=1296344 RepID=A0A2T1C532_9CYAN|nr:transcription antitermination factor NusB [Merismopedia glauca]PSB03334.1 transcription antitermination factor NusB [Merismopedia glauca CCAP 1448/3]